jgi:protein-S-isoprenylcysteine O-methyltransferase
MVEWWMFSGKSIGLMTPVQFTGLILTLAGQLLRSGAMRIAGRNFTHEIATTKERSHELVTTGIYSYVINKSKYLHPDYSDIFDTLHILVSVYGRWVRK